jgi:hypothetical protein
MRRLALLLVPAALACAAPAAGSAAPASVRVAECTPALEPGARTATFEARIRAAAGADRLAVRFTLQARGQDELEWRRVTAPGFGAWLTSDRGVGRFSYAKTVLNLSAPTSYRVVVRFRWLAPDGEVLHSAKETSHVCRQPDLRPDLVARRIDVLAAEDPGERRYVVALRNVGRTAAPGSTVALRAGAALLATVITPALAPGATRSVTFTAPACVPGEPLVATADAGLAVDEADERNELIVPCPEAE